MRALVSILLLALPLSCYGQGDYITKLLHKYKRPVTLIYISNDPQWLCVEETDIVVYWTPNQEFHKEFLKHRPSNCLLLQSKITVNRVAGHARETHYDIAIIDHTILNNEVDSKCHLADHTFVLSASPSYNFQKTKEAFFQRPVRPYNIKSDYEHKYLIKKKNRIEVIWLPGLALREFILAEGIYPRSHEYWDQIIENFSPLDYSGYKPRNMILQGQNPKTIDYTDHPTGYLRNLEEKQIKKIKQKLLYYTLLAKVK